MNSLHRMGYTSIIFCHSVAKRHSRWRNVITSQGERALPLQWQVVKLSQGHDKVTRTRDIYTSSCICWMLLSNQIFDLK